MALPSSNPALIKASGGDYTTLTAWEADLDDSALDADYAAEIDGQVSGNVSFFGIDGSGGSPDPWKVIIREFDTPAIGSNEGTCAKTVGRIGLFGSAAVRYEISGIEISDEIYGVGFGNSDISTEYTVTKCVIRDTTTTAGMDIQNTHTTNVPIRIGCNLLINCGTAAYDMGIKINDASLTTSVLVFNNTIFHSAPVTNSGGFYEAAGDFGDVRNNAVCYYDNRDATTPIDYYNSPSNMDYCAGSGDGTVTGANSIDTLRDDGTDWTDTSTYDFSLVSDGVLVGEGQTISGESWFPATDLAGTTWASPPAIGCFEVVVAGLTKNLSDTINMSDAKIINFGLNKSDSISLSDSTLKNFGLNKSDFVSLSDALSKLVGFDKSDSISLSDSIIKAPNINKADTISMSDSLLSKAFDLNKSDTMNLSDIIAKAVGIDQADTINLTDNISYISSFVRSFSDTINLIDVISKESGIAFSDTINLSDGFNAIITLILSLNDTINMSDDLSKSVGLSKSDTINLSDNITYVSAFIRSFADNINLTDDIIKEFGLSKADIINLTDNLSTSAVTIYALLNFLAKNRTFNFNAELKTFNFDAKNKIFNFNARSRGTE